MGEGCCFFSLLLVILALSFIIFKYRRSPTLPPGPFSWPIIGNLLDIGNKPHISLAQLAEVHGPLISLRLGTQLLVVASTPAAAIKILKEHDRVLSARFIPNAIPEKNPAHTQYSLAWADCTYQWNYLRTICRSEVFSTRAIDSQTNLREVKVFNMIELLAQGEGEVFQIQDTVFDTVFNTLTNIIFSQDFITSEGLKEGEGMKSITRKFTKLGAIPNLADFYPIFSGFDLQGLRKKNNRYFAQICGFWEVIVSERRQRKGKGESAIINGQRDFLDILLDNGFTNDQINYLITELLVAGSDTTTSTVEWAMTELMKNEDAMNSVCDELEREINYKIVKESDLSRLPYLNACIKEVLRLHTPTPLLLPRRALETIQVMNCTIPKDSQVLVNVWAIGRDPMTWDDPLEFNPERFLGSRVDLNSNEEFGWIPFGGGRRICPGLSMATKQVGLILASLINRFSWSLPHDMRPSELDMGEEFGITLQKQKPLMLIPRVKR